MAHGDAPRTIKLRYAATCTACGVAMPAGAQAVWNKAAGGAFCQSCGAGTVLSGRSSPNSPPEPPSPGTRTADTEPPPVAYTEISDAGRSAQAGWQVTAVRGALGDLDAPIHPALCFTSSDWGWFAKPFGHEGVLVAWTSKLADMIAATGVLGPEQIEQVASRLAHALKPAT